MQVSANLIYFEPHPRALAFLRAVETYLDRKFAEPHLWMADQAALFRGLCLTTAQDGSVPTFNDPVIAGGAVFPDCLVGSHILEEGVRRKKRTLGDGLGVAIDPVSLKPVWHTLPSGAEPPTAAPVPV